MTRNRPFMVQSHTGLFSYAKVFKQQKAQEIHQILHRLFSRVIEKLKFDAQATLKTIWCENKPIFKES